jgi:zinc protease
MARPGVSPGVLVLVFLLAAGVLLPLPRAEAALSDHVCETTLKNGLKVLLLENHKAPLVTFQVWYRVGARNEQWGKTGLSHMLEHMMFKGTDKVGPEEFSRIIAKNGGDENAFTTADFTAYFENMSADRIMIPLALEADRMRGIRLREADFVPERSVVMEERRLRTEDNPKSVLGEQLNATAFQVQPYHWPVIGWMEDIAAYTIDDLRRYHATYYVPANAFLVVVGDFRKEDLLPAIEREFGSIPGGAPPAQRAYREAPQQGERRLFLRKEDQLPTVVKAYHMPNLTDRAGYLLEGIEWIRSQGESSRLTRSLVRENELALNADADNDLVSRDPNLFSISADVLPGKDAAVVEKAMVARA